MNPVIRHLRALASLDEKLRRLGERRRAVREAVTSAEQALSEAEGQLTSRTDEVRTLRKEADALNLEVRSAEDAIAKHDEQLRAAKSNKEYDILRRQLETATKRKGDLEDQVLERLERADAVTEEEVAARSRLYEARKALDAARGEAESTEAEVSADEEALGRERGEVAPKLDAQTRRLYEKVLGQRGDSAMAEVTDDVCSGCARKLSPQMENLVTVGEELVQCMSCQRILYLDDAE